MPDQVQLISLRGHGRSSAPSLPRRSDGVLLPWQVPEPRTDLGVVYLLYNITKAAVLHGTKLEAAEPYLTSRGITVATNCPGWCRVRQPSC